MTLYEPEITIVGSFVTDLMSRSPRLPCPGETVMGGPFSMGPGGKGANQAVAAARLGAKVNILVSLGTDEFGDLAFANLAQEGISLEYIKRANGVPTGTALIIVDSADGENMIVVSPGSNDELSVADVEAAREAILASDYILMQLEIPLETVKHAACLAHENGVKVILNPAPGRELPNDLLAMVDVFTPNETEASIISGVEVVDMASAETAAKVLLDRGCRAVIITLGAMGVLIADGSGTRHIPSFSVNAIDTTGAGDAFNGALAVALGEGMSLDEACRFANAAAAISVTRIGTSVAMARRQEVNEFLAMTGKVSNT